MGQTTIGAGDGTDDGKGRWLAIHATVFVASFCVMVVELVAGRIVSRHLGASIYTWTSVIGVILAGLAVGNWIGGRLADRFPARPMLGLLFLLSSATCVAMSVGNNLVGSWHALWDLPWPLRVATHVGVVFWLPAALLGTIGPVAAKLALGLGRRTGRTLGNVYAWGVVGSIVGTFTTGYVLIDRIGTGAILWVVAGLLAVVGILYTPLSKRAWGWAALLLLTGLLANGSWAWARQAGEWLALREVRDPAILYRDESLYSHIEIRALSDRSDVRGMFLDKLLHSQVSMSDPGRLHYDYSRIFGALTHALVADDARLATLTIGGGGYVFPRYLETTWPGSRIDVVEIDPAVTRAARLSFGLPADTSIRTWHRDGRVHVNRLIEERRSGRSVPGYDVIYLDAVNDYSVPYQLATVEFFGQVDELLAPGGAFLVNCIDILDSGRVIGALASTLSEVFPHLTVYTLEHHRRMRGDSRLTFVLAASRDPLPAIDAADVARLDDPRLEDYRDRVNGLVLTDDYAPVETLLAPVVLASSREVAAGEALARALRAYERDDLEGYVRYSSEALDRDPHLAEAHFNLGIGLYKQGRTAEAIDRWRVALGIRNDYAEAHFNLGAAYYAERELDAALLHLTQASRFDPELAEAHVAAGIVLEALGRRGMAAERYRRALRLDPGHEEARAHLSRVEHPG